MTLRTTLGAAATLTLLLAGAAQAAPAAAPVLKPAVKPAASPTSKGFFCNMTPPDPAKAPATGDPAPTDDKDDGDKGDGKKDTVAPPVTPATPQTQQQPAPTPQ